MKILVASPIFSQWFDSGLFWMRAFANLGHSLYPWDYRLQSEMPKVDTDASIIFKGESIDPKILPRPKVIYWPDALERTPGIENTLRLYDKVFTPVRPTPDWMEWLPTGWDPTIHRDLNIERNANTLYIGTANSPYKVKMVTVIQPFWVAGNGWGPEALPPQYLHDFVSLANRAKILIDIHQSPTVGLGRKFFEMIACGFTIVDDVPGVREILGDDLADKVTFKSASGAKELIEFYLKHPEVRGEKWEKEKECIAGYTYINCAKILLEGVTK